MFPRKLFYLQEPSVKICSGEKRKHGGRNVPGSEDCQVEEIIEKKENGLDSQVEQGGRNFSGGQRQRLTIARALSDSRRF